MDLSIIIVNWNTGAMLEQCLASIVAAPPAGEYEVWVIDNASSDASSRVVRDHFPQVNILQNERNIGFAAANNQALSRCRGSDVLLLNPDTRVHPGAIARLQQQLARQAKAGGAGPRLLNADGTPQLSVERTPTLVREAWRLFHLNWLYPLSHYSEAALKGMEARTVEVVKGACLLLRREAIPPAELFDEDYFIYSEEIDLCARLHQAGWELHWVPEAVVTHIGGQSTNQAAEDMFVELYRNKILFFRKRRGAATASLYKMILLAAAVTRIVLGLVVRPFPLPQRARWGYLTRQYGRLLAALPGL